MRETRHVLKLQLEAKDVDAMCIKKSVVFKYIGEQVAIGRPAVTGTRAFIPPACGGRVAFIASH